MSENSERSLRTPLAASEGVDLSLKVIDLLDQRVLGSSPRRCTERGPSERAALSLSVKLQSARCDESITVV